MKQLLNSITPNKSVDGQTRSLIIILWCVMTFLIWNFSGHKVLPTPHAIFTAATNLLTNKDANFNVIPHLMISTILCLKAVLYSVIISLGIAILSVLPIFRPFTNIGSKARFLSTVGLTFIFAKLTETTNDEKVALLVFCISVFMVTSFISIIFEVKKDELDYARTLKFGEWQTVWEVIILGKADQFLEAIKQNFAIAWIMLSMVENLCRAEGGIGVILFQENKTFHLDSVYAIQIMVLLIGIGIDWSLGFIRRIFCPYSVITLERK